MKPSEDVEMAEAPIGVAPRSAIFLATPSNATPSRTATPPAEYWVVHGMHYRIPPLFDQLHAVRPETAPGFHSYTQWARSSLAKSQPSNAPARSSGGSASRGSLAALKRPAGPVMLPGEENLNEAERDVVESLKRAYTQVVKRDVPRQQKAFATRQRRACYESSRSSGKTATVHHLGRAKRAFRSFPPRGACSRNCRILILRQFARAT